MDMFDNKKINVLTVLKR